MVLYWLFVLYVRSQIPSCFHIKMLNIQHFSQKILHRIFISLCLRVTWLSHHLLLSSSPIIWDTKLWNGKIHILYLIYIHFSCLILTYKSYKIITIFYLQNGNFDVNYVVTNLVFWKMVIVYITTCITKHVAPFCCYRKLYFNLYLICFEFEFMGKLLNIQHLVQLSLKWVFMLYWAKIISRLESFSLFSTLIKTFGFV